MLDFLSLHFVQHALVACLLASITCGIVGTLILLNRLVFLAGGVAHAGYGGIGIAIYFQLPLLPSLLAFTSGASLLMGTLSAKNDDRTEVLIGALWAAGMATGIILLNLLNSYNADLMSYLFGSLLAVSSGDLIMMTIIVVGIVGLTVWRYDDFLMISFDKEYARTRRVPVFAIYLALLIMTALATVVLIRVVGIILTIALLTIPPYIGMHYAHRLWKMILIAGASALVFCLGGFFAAYWLNITAGAAIIMFATATLGIILSLEALNTRLKRRKIIFRTTSSSRKEANDNQNCC
jgi:zinc transport system permease protein